MFLQDCPGVRLEVKGPHVVEFLILFIFSSKDNELVLIDDCRMAGPCGRAEPRGWFDLLPFPSMKIESVDLVRPHSIDKATEDEHRLFT